MKPLSFYFYPNGSVYTQEQEKQIVQSSSSLSSLSPSSPDLGLLPPVVRYVSPWITLPSQVVSLVIVEGRPQNKIFHMIDEDPVEISVPWHHWFIWLQQNPSGFSLKSVSLFFSNSQLYDEDHVFYSNFLPNFGGLYTIVTEDSIQASYPFLVSPTIPDFLFEETLKLFWFGDDWLNSSNFDLSTKSYTSGFTKYFIRQNILNCSSLCLGDFDDIHLKKYFSGSFSQMYDELLNLFWNTEFNKDGLGENFLYYNPNKKKYDFYHELSYPQFLSSLSIDDIHAQEKIKLCSLFTMRDVVSTLENPSLVNSSVMKFLYNAYISSTPKSSAKKVTSSVFDDFF